jgi:glucose-6-phosphate dehydrogenase assembly protein OpcA
VEAAVSAPSIAPTTLIARLEKELRDLWAKPTDPGQPALSRVCTMNLEVVAGSKELLERYTPVVDEVTASIPARAILASIEPDATGDEITGSATAVCSLDNGRNICSERITLAATGNACARSASAIEAFLVPEIPTVLVWLGRVHVDDPVFEDLANDAQRIILDSEYTSLGSLLHVASWARKQRNRPHVADLAWTRLASWQELLARFFDGAETRGFTSKITRIQLKQASDPGARLGPESALMLGWIATRLDWKTSRLGGTLRFKRPDGGSVVIELGSVPRPAGVAPAALAALTIEATSGDQTLKGHIQRELGSGMKGDDATPDADIVTWQREMTGKPPFEQHVRLGANKAAKWLERTLHRPPVDVAFDESVAFAEQIVEDGLTVA